MGGAIGHTRDRVVHAALIATCRAAHQPNEVGGSRCSGAKWGQAFGLGMGAAV